MDVYTFSKDAARQIQNVIRRVERVRPAQAKPPKPITQASAYIAKTGGSGIPARSGTTPGSASVALYRINYAGTLVPVVDDTSAAIEILVYNVSSSAVAANAYVQVKQEVFGRYVVDFEDCG